MFALGVELMYRGVKIGSPYFIALISILPELILTIESSMRSNYYVALSTVLGSVVSLYVIGISFFGIVHFLRWKSHFKVGKQREFPFIVVTSLLLGLLPLFGRLDFLWGIIFLILFLFYSAIKMTSTKINARAIPSLLAGGLIIWFSSGWLLQDIFSISSAFHIPPYYVAVFIVPIMSNIQEISTAFRSKKENVMREFLLGVINENVMASTLLLAIIGFASGINGVELNYLNPMIEISFLVGTLAYVLVKNGEIRLSDSLIMILGLLLFISQFYGKFIIL
ncbi:sodium:calcium antiporter [Metallosphaera tengchongensis]|uniref:Sodium:calcium antiporter n=2 Tax=Metallosphaera tengchongensis TaxID=1532350 RepID=A0A6N0NXV9_9CREN|nr:sodium:calcium antiporter [Metallosphaera tengchongensis]